MVAVSQAPSPESNPNSPLPVTGTVVNYTTVNLIGGKFIQHRIRRCFRNIRLPQQWQLPEGVGFCSGELHPTPHLRFYPSVMEWREVFLTGISDSFRIVIPSEAQKHFSVGQTINRLMSRTQTS